MKIKINRQHRGVILYQGTIFIVSSRAVAIEKIDLVLLCLLFFLRLCSVLTD